MEYSAGGALNLYAPGIGQLVNNVPSIYLADSQGSTVALSGVGGGISGQYKYDSWGNRLVGPSSWQTPFAYVGKDGYVSDPDTGLMKLGARYYDPTIGRFITKDPARDGTNWYAYCAGNPVNAVDPTGNTSVPNTGGYFWQLFTSYFGGSGEPFTVASADVDHYQTNIYSAFADLRVDLSDHAPRTESVTYSTTFFFPGGTTEASDFGRIRETITGTLWVGKDSWCFKGTRTFEDTFDFDTKNNNWFINEGVQFFKTYNGNIPMSDQKGSSIFARLLFTGGAELLVQRKYASAKPVPIHFLPMPVYQTGKIRR